MSTLTAPNRWHPLCPCQWGTCGACDGTSDQGRPRHDRCLSRQHGHPIVYPLTWLCSRRGFVIGPPLWRTDGPPCRYICDCSCPKTGPVDAPPRRRPAAPDRPEIPAPAPAAQADDGALFNLEVS